MSFPFDPTRIYEINGQVYPLLSTPFTPVGTGNNQTAISGTAGKRIAVMGWIAQSSTGTVGSYLFKSSTGPVALSSPLAAPPVTNGELHSFLPRDSYYFKTALGDDLTIDVITAVVYMTIFYIVYTP